MYGEFMSCFIVLIKKKQIIVCDMLLFYLLFTAGLYKLSDSLVWFICHIYVFTKYITKK